MESPHFFFLLIQLSDQQFWAEKQYQGAGEHQDLDLVQKLVRAVCLSPTHCEPTLLTLPSQHTHLQRQRFMCLRRSRSSRRKNSFHPTHTSTSWQGCRMNRNLIYCWKNRNNEYTVTDTLQAGNTAGTLVFSVCILCHRIHTDSTRRFLQIFFQNNNPLSLLNRKNSSVFLLC